MSGCVNVTVHQQCWLHSAINVSCFSPVFYTLWSSAVPAMLLEITVWCSPMINLRLNANISKWHCALACDFIRGAKGIIHCDKKKRRGETGWELILEKVWKCSGAAVGKKKKLQQYLGGEQQCHWLQQRCMRVRQHNLTHPQQNPAAKVKSGKELVRLESLLGSVYEQGVCKLWTALYFIAPSRDVWYWSQEFLWGLGLQVCGLLFFFFRVS